MEDEKPGEAQLDNSRKEIAFFNESFSDEELEEWQSSTVWSLERGYYTCANRLLGIMLFDSSFKSCGELATIRRMVNHLDIICGRILEGSVDREYILAHLGSYLDTCNQWLKNTTLPSKHFDRYRHIRAFLGSNGTLFEKKQCDGISVGKEEIEHELFSGLAGNLTRLQAAKKRIHGQANAGC